MTTNTNHTNSSNYTHANDNAGWYQPADPYTSADAFGVREKDLSNYPCLARPLCRDGGFQLAACAAEHRHLLCCGVLFPARLLIVEGRIGSHADIHREGKCPRCGALFDCSIRIDLDGIIVTRVSGGAETAWLRQLTPKPRGTWLEEFAFWSEADWKKQDCELADEHRVPHVKVWEWRLKLGQPRAPRHRHPRTSREAAKYRNADWTKPVAVLAREFGVSRQRIHQVRQKLRQQNSRGVADVVNP